MRIDDLSTILSAVLRLCCYFRPASCFAQLATVQGEARDTSQAVVPGAPVTVTNSKTNVAASIAERTPRASIRSPD